MILSRRSMLCSAASLLVPRLALADAPLRPISENLDRNLAALDDYILETLRRTRIPGLSVAVVHADQVVHLKGFGVRRAGAPEPVDPDTVFQLASLSKPVATTVVAALAGDGVVAWDDPIIRHDPAFAMQDAWVTREVTLRDMFCHRSGLPDHAGDRLEDIGYGRDEILHRLRCVRPGSSFRSHYAYTNFGFTAAAVAAAMAAGKPWEDVSAERLYRPLGMTRTSSRFADFIATPNRAWGHVRDGDGWAAKYSRNPDAQSPAGGVSSSVRDLAQWLRLQLGRGAIDGRVVVNAAALDETHLPQIVSAPAKNAMSGRSTFYGLGWNVGHDAQDQIRWGHSGAFNLGAATCVNVLPQAGIGIVCLTNAFPIGAPEAICQSFLDLVLEGRITKDWVALFGEAFIKITAPDYGTAVDYAKRPPNVSPPLSTAAYVGRYANALYGLIEVTANDADLALHLGPNGASYALHHFGRDVFIYQPVGENAYGPSGVTFAVAAGGKAASVTIENLDIDGQGRFERLAG